MFVKLHETIVEKSEIDYIRIESHGGGITYLDEDDQEYESTPTYLVTLYRIQSTTEGAYAVQLFVTDDHEEAVKVFDKCYEALNASANS